VQYRLFIHNLTNDVYLKLPFNLLCVDFIKLFIMRSFVCNMYLIIKYNMYFMYLWSIIHFILGNIRNMYIKLCIWILQFKFSNLFTM